MPNSVLRSHREEPNVRPLPAVEAPPRPLQPPRRTVPLVVIVGILGLLLGWILGSSGQAGPAPVTRLGGEAEAEGLTASIPGLEETLLAVGTNGSSAMDLAVWPPRGALSIRPLPAAWTAITFEQRPFEAFASFDSSMRYLALAEPVARDGAVTLLAGRLEEVEPVATGVSSYAWHATAPRSLAYVVEDEGRFIEVMSGSPRSVERVGAVDGDAELVAWGDWGYLLQRDGELAVWPEGATVAGSFLSARGDDLLINSAGALISWNPRRGTTTQVAADPAATVAVFDAAKEAILVANPQGLAIIPADGDLEQLLEWPLINHAAWSSDGRFVVFADRVDVMILDRETGEVVRTGLGRSVAVGVRPLLSSR